MPDEVASLLLSIIYDLFLILLLAKRWILKLSLYPLQMHICNVYLCDQFTWIIHSGGFLIIIHGSVLPST
jgi:hypothetical protein